MSKRTIGKTICIILLLLAASAFAAGCGRQEPESPDLKYYDNGYGTYFVMGTRIEHSADDSDSEKVDWRKSKPAKAPEEAQIREEKGIIYSTASAGTEEMRGSRWTCI